MTQRVLFHTSRLVSQLMVQVCLS